MGQGRFVIWGVGRMGWGVQLEEYMGLHCIGVMGWYADATTTDVGIPVWGEGQLCPRFEKL